MMMSQIKFSSLFHKYEQSEQMIKLNEWHNIF